MNKWTVLIGVAVVLVIGAIVFIVLPPPAKAPTNNDIGNAIEKQDLIRADFPRPNTKISSPLVAIGQARGNWYFEASFPVEVQDGSGNTIGQGYAQAQGEWMTTDFVPFKSISITFTAQPSGSKGFVILRKDNPSGLPENDDQLIIPVTF